MIAFLILVSILLFSIGAVIYHVGHVRGYCEAMKDAMKINGEVMRPREEHETIRTKEAGHVRM